MDRGYLDFVTRAKSNTQFRRLTAYYSSKDYPTALRRVVVKDDTGKRITFLANNFALKPELIADLYRQRWKVELFFKWIKRHLRIKAFLGTWMTLCLQIIRYAPFE